jgi:hypothetical protein
MGTQAGSCVPLQQPQDLCIFLCVPNLENGFGWVIGCAALLFLEFPEFQIHSLKNADKLPPTHRTSLMLDVNGTIHVKVLVTCPQS